MRVSKTVREYIKKEVNAKAQPKYDELDKIYQTEKEKIELAAEEIGKRFEDWKKECNEILKRNGCLPLEEESRWNRILTYEESHIRTNFIDNTYHKEKEKIRRQIEEVTNEIIVNLELGGTKDDLAKMLSEIKF